MLYPNYPMWHTPRLQTKDAIHKPINQEKRQTPKI